MARKEKKYHFIYKTTNLLSGKYYIGMHSTDNLDDGYLGSGNRLRLAIRKHGKENFKREILELFDTRKELREREEIVVNLEEIAKEECMNLRVGGEGGWTPEANQAFKDKLENDPEFRKKFSDEQRERTLKLIKEGKIKTYTKENRPDNTGIPHSQETKKKISETKKNQTKGEKNSQYGTLWVTNGEENKKINKEDLDQYIEGGWKRGRTKSKNELNKINEIMGSKRKVERPPYEQLVKEIEELGLAGCGRKYGVHYTAIKKWRLHYEKYM
jgi:hypothetical protein